MDALKKEEAQQQTDADGNPVAQNDDEEKTDAIRMELSVQVKGDPVDLSVYEQNASAEEAQ